MSVKNSSMLAAAVLALATLTVPASAADVSVRLYGGDLQNFNPAIATSFASKQMDMALYDRLLTFDAQGAFQPYLATSWEVTPTSATFKLRTDATCSDGTPVTATVIKNSLEYFGDPKTASGARQATFGSGTFTITADDAAATLKIELSEPHGDLLLGLAQVPASIICPAGLKDPGSLSSTPAGSGPFTLVKAEPGNQYVLQPRKDYKWGPFGYDPAKFAYDNIVAKVLLNEATVANLLTTGGLDVGNVSGRDALRVEQAPGIFTAKTSIPGSDVLVVNQRKGRIGVDANVRKAIYLLVNADELNLAASAGLARRSDTAFSPENGACYTKDDGQYAVGYDPDAAAKLLEGAGWTKTDGKWTKDGQPLTLDVVIVIGQGATADYLQSALSSAGIAARVTVLDVSSYLHVVLGNGTGEWDVTYFPLPGPNPSPNNIAQQVMGDDNFARIANADFDKLAKQAAQSVGQAACASWQAAEKALLTSPDVKPIATEDIVWFGNKVQFTNFGGVMIDFTSLKPVS